MRPIFRGLSPIAVDYGDYANAKPDLVSRMGSYCSFCERRIATNLAVEHIQAKKDPDFEHLVGCWDNFLLGCVNCNSTKGMKRVEFANFLLPDRDNTFAAFSYPRDGRVEPSTASHIAGLAVTAESTLALTGLDKPISECLDENGKAIAIDRVGQRMEAWATALAAKNDIDGNPGIMALRQVTINLALATGFFSIWMEAFAGDVDFRNRLIDAFFGTRQSGCFDPITTQAISPAPNPGYLTGGGKL